MIKNCDEAFDINHNPNWPFIPRYRYRTLIVNGLGSGKTINKTPTTRY